MSSVRSIPRSLLLGSSILFLCFLECCHEGGNEASSPDSGASLPHGLPQEEPARPGLFVTAEDKPRILARIGGEPWSSILAVIQERAERPYREQADPKIWDHAAHGQNGETAQNSAMLAWLFDDEQAASKAREFLARLPTDYETHDTIDIHIRMPHTLIGYANAVDLLSGTPFFTREEYEAGRDKLAEITNKLYEQYVDKSSGRNILLCLAQNNYNVRTAGAIGYTALAFPEHEDADRWIDYAASELSYMFKPEGRYVQPDGAVSEGPYYYNLSFSVALAFSIAYANRVSGVRELDSVCSTRSPIGAWADHGCEEGAPFLFTNLLDDPLFFATADWTTAIRLPWGDRPPIADGRFMGLTGAALLTRLGGEDHHVWDFLTNTNHPLEMTYSLDVAVFHLGGLPDTVSMTEPAWTNRFFLDGGDAVFRSGWDPDARWLLLKAEQGSARQTLHDHVDSTSFSMAAYGEYLLIDPGYYKPDEMDNARTAQSWAHNVLLIEGRTAPDKGLITSFGDSDAFLKNTYDGTDLAHAEAHQEYQQTLVERSILFARRRYFLVADRLTTTAQEPRLHAFRLNGYAGYDSGGLFLLDGGTMLWERGSAGVRVHLACTAPGMQIEEPPFVELMAPHVHEMASHSEVGHHGVGDGLVTALAPRFLAVLSPYAVGADPSAPEFELMVEPLFDGPGIAAFSIVSNAVGDTWTDVVLLRDPDASTELELTDGTSVATDAELVFFSLEGQLDLALLARGTFLSVNGVLLLSNPAEDPLVVRE